MADLRLIDVDQLGRRLGGVTRSILADKHDERLRTGEGVDDALDLLGTIRDDLDIELSDGGMGDE